MTLRPMQAPPARALEPPRPAAGRGHVSLLADLTRITQRSWEAYYSLPWGSDARHCWPISTRVSRSAVRKQRARTSPRPASSAPAGCVARPLANEPASEQSARARNRRFRC